MTIRIGTRRSPLALAQATEVADRLRETGAEVELVGMTTSGDRNTEVTGPAGLKGMFVAEIVRALRDGDVDLAVHSAKDLPGELPPGLGIVAVPSREDPRDVLIGPDGGLDGLPAGATVATGSPRRAAQLRLLRPDVVFAEIRGNVGTRLDKLAAGAADALVLAAAGLARLDLRPPRVTPLAVERCVPAPGQGALAIEGRIDRPDLVAAVAGLDDAATAACVRAERAALAALGGGCREPIGVIATVHGDELTLVGFAATQDGAAHARGEITGAAGDAERLGDTLAARLRQRLAGP